MEGRSGASLRPRRPGVENEPGKTMAKGARTETAAEARLCALVEERLSQAALELPLLPATATRVLDACSREELDARDLAALVQNDPSLAANVLRVANSAAYSPREPIVSLQQAIGRLGFSTLSSIALSAAMRNQIRVPGWESYLDLLWAHSTRVGAWAREIARARRKSVEGAFLCGLLHDVGRAIVLTAACELSRAHELPFKALALQAWSDDWHERAGAALLAAWSVPDWAVAAVREHHACLARADASEEAYTVSLADRCAHATASGVLSDLDRAELAVHPALVPLGLYPEELGSILDRAVDVERTVEGFA